MKFYIIALLILFFLFGCEKKIEFVLKEAPELLTVDASIENDEEPVVILTKSLNYFSKISAGLLSRSLVTDAQVFISDGVITHLLKRYDVTLPGNVPFSFYATDPASPATIITGVLGKSYSIKIVWKGQEYKSNTTIPILKKTVDSLWAVKALNTPDTSTKMILRAKVTDPPGFGDYIRYYTKVNREPFYPGLNSAFDDQLVNGTTYIVDVDKGADRNSEIDFDNFAFFKKGDTVTLKFSNINKATFDFWRTVDFSYQSIGNPFSSPTKIIGNISNGALGYFGGYANQFKTIVIPK